MRTEPADIHEDVEPSVVDGSDRSITNSDQYVRYILQKRSIRLPLIPETCVMTHSQGVLDMACSRFPFQVIDLGAHRPVDLHCFGPQDAPLFAMVAGPLGAPMAAVLLEELISLGFEKFLAIGAVGHPVGPLGSDLAPGDLIVADGAFIYEGVSSHYHPGATAAYPDPALLARLKMAVNLQNVSFHQGPVATTDAFYRETPSFLREILARGAIGIDMELSALFSVSTFHQRQTAALLYISDILSLKEERWELSFVDELVNRAEQAAFATLLDLFPPP